MNYINPYKDDFDSALRFVIDLKNMEYLSEESFKIVLKPRSEADKELVRKAENNAEVFRIEERYFFHKDVVVDILRKMKYYSSFKKREILDILNTDYKSFILFRSILFPEESCDINSTILGKLKRDVIQNFI